MSVALFICTGTDDCTVSALFSLFLNGVEADDAVVMTTFHENMSAPAENPENSSKHAIKHACSLDSGCNIHEKLVMDTATFMSACFSRYYVTNIFIHYIVY